MKLNEINWAVSIFQDFGAMQSSVMGCWCGRQSVQDTTTIQALLQLFSPARPARSARRPAKGCPATGSSLLQLSWPSWQAALPRSLHNWLKLPPPGHGQPQRSHPTAADFPSAQAHSIHLQQPPSSTCPHPVFSINCFFVRVDMFRLVRF